MRERGGWLLHDEATPHRRFIKHGTLNVFTELIDGFFGTWEDAISVIVYDDDAARQYSGEKELQAVQYRLIEIDIDVDERESPLTHLWKPIRNPALVDLHKREALERMVQVFNSRGKPVLLALSLFPRLLSVGGDIFARLVT